MREITIVRELSGKGEVTANLNALCGGKGEFISDLRISLHAPSYPVDLESPAIRRIFLRNGMIDYMDVYDERILHWWGMFKHSYGFLGPIEISLSGPTGVSLSTLPRWITLPTVISFFERAVLPLKQDWSLRIEWNEWVDIEAVLTIQVLELEAGESIFDHIEDLTIPYMIHDFLKMEEKRYRPPGGYRYVETVVMLDGMVDREVEMVISTPYRTIKVPWSALVELTERRFGGGNPKVVMIPWNEVPLAWGERGLDLAYEPWAEPEDLDGYVTLWKANVFFEFEGYDGRVQFLHIVEKR